MYVVVVFNVPNIIYFISFLQPTTKLLKSRSPAFPQVSLFKDFRILPIHVI